jgi:hypothetical protein
VQTALSGRVDKGTLRRRAADVAAFEQVVGHPMPELLKRMCLEVANGGFGPWKVVSLTDTGAWFGDCADITTAYRGFTDPDDGLPRVSSR